MELKDTVEMMNSEDYKERFKAEYHQTRIRAKKLGEMLRKYHNKELGFTPICPIETLENQLLHMNSYLHVMKKRAKFEGIDLKWEVED